MINYTHARQSKTNQSADKEITHLQSQKRQIYPLEYHINPMRNISSSKYIDRRRLARQQVDDDGERKPQVGKREPGEDEREDVVLNTIQFSKMG